MTGQRIALVTGAARGIGAGIAERLAGDGHRVILADILPEVAETAERIGRGATAVTVDLGRLDTVEDFLRDLSGREGPIDILVNNAGISPKHDGRKALVKDTALSEWQRVLDINLTAAFLLCKAAVPSMQERGWGRIVNMASQAARTRSQVAGSHYAASKAGLLGFSRALAGEVAPDGITVNCIAPGRIESPMVAEAGAEVNAQYVTAIPVGRIGMPVDVAQAVSFYASDATGFVTGTVLDVNGGHFMG